MTKPKVTYAGVPEFYTVGEDEGCRIYVFDHPRLGNGWVRTSKVIKKNPDGSFETLNTLYEPVKDVE